MDERGYIHRLNDKQLAGLDTEYRGQLKPLSDRESEHLQKIPRKLRRAALAQYRGGRKGEKARRVIEGQR